MKHKNNTEEETRKSLKALKKAWGINFDDNLSLIRIFLEDLFPTRQERIKFFKKTGIDGISIGNNVDMANFLLKVVRKAKNGN